MSIGLRMIRKDAVVACWKAESRRLNGGVQKIQEYYHFREIASGLEPVM
jgi:hypothetical protein